MRIRILSTLAFSLTLFLAAPTIADDASAVYQKRVDMMKEIGRNAAVLGRAAKGANPFGADTAEAAAAMDAVIQALTPAVFAPGSEVGKSNLKPEAAAQPDLLAKYIADLKTASAKLAVVAKGTDNAATIEAFQTTGKACGACHQDFRKPLQ